MSGKLDQSLDAIMKDRPAGSRRGGRAGRLPARKAAAKSKAATAAVVAPAGGIAKKTKAARPTKAPAVVPAHTGDSKISVSNLPTDVTETLIKDYFGQSVAPVKKVILNYGPNGRSRGSATVLFSKPTAAAEAVQLDGTVVDGKKMRIEILMGAQAVPAPQAPKPLSERVTKQPKNAAKDKPKQAGAAKGQAGANGATADKKKTKKAKSGRAGKPKAKTAEELDAEMQDYFGSGDAGAAAANGTAPAAATNGADTGMVDEVM
ncbi:hypothetical protein CKM354_000476600 [Cercospora kikuchii]|uniref:RRM domain-containing protein n=1 Tax=Cercospora kikuchii TaxID=84275 RepID=A0A9P3FBT4_9PEZI|nr:uncharacterized protein CKM354_000476600 [Cercospora kikuchii]GIZ41463.1 hypothetical protein CKM354_000476600 [Cercospora kikuchii]